MGDHVQSTDAAQMRPNNGYHGYNCSDPRQWAVWNEVVLRREKNSRTAWCGQPRERISFSCRPFALLCHGFSIENGAACSKVTEGAHG